MSLLLIMKLKKVQRDHYARAALVKGLMLAHEQGTGKSFAAFCIPYVWRARRVLIAAPMDLHDPLRKEAIKHFRIALPILFLSLIIATHEVKVGLRYCVVVDLRAAITRFLLVSPTMAA